MKLNSPITPYAIYDKYHELNKFKECPTTCEYEYISDNTRLPSFQFQRPTSDYPILKAWLRKDCQSFYNKITDVNESQFIDGSGWTNVNAAYILNGKANFVISSPPGSNEGLYSTHNLTVGKKYMVKVVVIEKKITTGQLGLLYLENGMFSAIADFSTVGTHYTQFIATDPVIGLGSNVSGVNDYIRVSEFEIFEIQDLSIPDGDYQLNVDEFKIVNIGATDVIYYCGTPFANTLPCGKYFLILQSIDSDGEPVYYFGETITIENFTPSQSPYILLEWSNPCDLYDVKYTGLACSYVNRLYVDNVTAKPDYLFTEEGQNNGEGTFNATFQKWEKKQGLKIPKTPEFLTDSLTAMRLHENIKFYEAIKKEQVQITEAIQVLSVEYTVEYIIQDCYANVDLKMLLNESIVDSACCKEIPIQPVECVECGITVEGIGVYVVLTGYALDYVEGKLQLFAYNPMTMSWDEQELAPDEWPIVCLENEDMYIYNIPTEEYVQVPSLYNIVNTGTGFKIFGYMLPGTVAQVTMVYQGVTYVYPVLYTTEELNAGVEIPYDSVPIIPETGQDLDVTVESFTAFCNYGFSNEVTLSFGGG